MEDFVYPEVMCYLVNKLLISRSFNTIKNGEIAESMQSPAFKSSGIMSLVENEKNRMNLQNGSKISFANSGKATNQIKGSLANLFKPEGDRVLCGIIESCDKKYPHVKVFLNKLFDFSKML